MKLVSLNPYIELHACRRYFPECDAVWIRRYREMFQSNTVTPDSDLLQLHMASQPTRTRSTPSLPTESQISTKGMDSESKSCQVNSRYV